MNATLEQIACRFDELESHEREIEQALPFAEDPAELLGELLEIDEAREELDLEPFEIRRQVGV